MQQQTYRDQHGVVLKPGDILTSVEYEGCPLNEEVVEWVFKYEPHAVLAAKEPIHDAEWETFDLYDQPTNEQGGLIGFTRKAS